MSDHEFTHDSLQDRSTIAAYLRALIDGFERGHLTLGAEGDTFTLEPSDSLELEISAKRKHGRGKLQLEIRWREADTSTSSDSLTIAVE